MEAEQNLVPKNSLTENLAYLAGYFEGEGCIFFNIPKNQAPLLVIKVTSGDKKILDQFSETFGGEIKQTKTSKIAKRQMWRWERWGKQAQDTLKQLFPYFKDIKKELTFLALVPVFNKVGKNITEDERDIRQRIAEQVLAINNRNTIAN